MSHTFTDPDLAELDRIWPLGRQLVVPKDGTIIVAGAYEGRYVAYLADLFPTAIIVGYEPQYEPCQIAIKRTRDLKLVSIYNRAIGTAKREVRLGNCGTDGASTSSLKGPTTAADMNDAVEIVYSFRDGIDLLLLNCEGSEWSLIPYLLDELMHHRIRSVAIQFHPKYVSNARAERVLEYLDEYYVRKYFDYPTWTYWERLPYI